MSATTFGLYVCPCGKHRIQYAAVLDVMTYCPNCRKITEHKPLPDTPRTDNCSIAFEPRLPAAK